MWPYFDASPHACILNMRDSFLRFGMLITMGEARLVDVWYPCEQPWKTRIQGAILTSKIPEAVAYVMSGMYGSLREIGRS